MISSNLFEQAVRKKLRFNINGELSIEDLVNANPDGKVDRVPFIERCIAYGKELEAIVDSFGKSSRFATKDLSTEQELTMLRLDIICGYVEEYNTKKNAMTASKELKEQEQRALRLLQAAEDRELAAKSPEELRKHLEKIRESMRVVK